MKAQSSHIFLLYLRGFWEKPVNALHFLSLVSIKLQLSCFCVYKHRTALFLLYPSSWVIHEVSPQIVKELGRYRYTHKFKSTVLGSGMNWEIGVDTYTWLILCIWALLAAQMVKNLPAMREMGVRSVDWEDPLEKGVATHSSGSWRIPWAEEPGEVQSMGLQRVGHSWVTNTFTFTYSR